MKKKSSKPRLWTNYLWGRQYGYPNSPECGRTVVTRWAAGIAQTVIAHVWGPGAGSTATESRTFNTSTATTDLRAEAEAWVEERVAALNATPNNEST